MWKYNNRKMNKIGKFYRLLPLAITLISASSVLNTLDECVFDATSITDDFLKANENIESYIWKNLENAKKAYVLLKNGDYVVVEKWAHTHYGMSATKIRILSSDEEYNMQYWKKDMLEFGEQFLSQSHFKAYQNVIENDDWIKGKTRLIKNDKYEINVPGFSYPEYYVTLERNQDIVIITICYYMN